jgi:cobalt-zinc-cadmium efflux system outer membrane protein
MKFRGLLLVAALSVCASPAVPGVQTIEAQTVEDQKPFRTLTFEQVVSEAIQNNLELLAERAELSVAEAGMITARLRPNPVLSGGANSLDWLGTGFNDINNAGPPEYSMRVDMPFERAHKRELRVDFASQTRRSAEAQFADAVRKLKLEVLLACIDILEAKSKLQLAEDNLQTLEKLVQLNQQRLTSGAIPPLELTRSRVAMLQYRGNVKSAQLGVAEARLKLLPLLGKKPGEDAIDVSDPLGVPPASAAADLPTLQSVARTTRPDLEAKRTDVARSQADLRLELAEGKVDYTLGAEYRRQQGTNGKGNMLGLFFSVPLPVFNRNQGEIARAGSEKEKADRTLAALETQVAGEVASAYEEFESSRQLLIEIERDLLQPTNEARAGTTYVYQAGATSLLDVLDAQRAFNDTMETYYSAQATYRRAQVKLALAVGKDVLP